jgi:DNA-directed RNA polymerase specialized sigma24 family protein
VGDPPDAPPSAAAAIRRDPGLYKRLFGYVLSRLGDVSRAEDVTGDVVAIALEGKRYPWDGETPILDHLGSIANTLIANSTRKASTRRERLKRDEDDPDPDQRDSRPSPSSFVAAETQEDRRVAMAAELVGHFEAKKDEVVVGSLRLSEEGEHSAERQATLLGCTVKDIYRARERVRHQRDVFVERARKRGEWP